jgi:Pyruvate/2-oxoacid:ferredoxin oxidoreductase delta subunit
LAYNYTLKRTVVDYEKCFGCGVCMHACGNEGLYLRPRSEIPAYADDY